MGLLMMEGEATGLSSDCSRGLEGREMPSNIDGNIRVTWLGLEHAILSPLSTCIAGSLEQKRSCTCVMDCTLACLRRRACVCCKLFATRAPANFLSAVRSGPQTSRPSALCKPPAQLSRGQRGLSLVAGLHLPLSFAQTQLVPCFQD